MEYAEVFLLFVAWIALMSHPSNQANVADETYPQGPPPLGKSFPQDAGLSKGEESTTSTQNDATQDNEGMLVKGGHGNDVLIGDGATVVRPPSGSGLDQAFGPGNDVLTGGGDKTLRRPGPGHDTLVGGVVYGPGDDKVRRHSGPRRKTLVDGAVHGPGDDVLTGGGDRPSPGHHTLEGGDE